MVKNVSFFFRISEKAGWAEDEVGNPADCSARFDCSLEVGGLEEIEVIREKKKEDARKIVSAFLGMNIEYLEVITESEYLAYLVQSNEVDKIYQ